MNILNAPFGARYSMTRQDERRPLAPRSLNAPFGARYFMTDFDALMNLEVADVLIHRLALGAL